MKRVAVAVFVGAAIATTVIASPTANAKPLRCPRAARVAEAQRQVLEQQLSALADQRVLETQASAPRFVFPLYRCPSGAVAPR